MIYQVTTKLYDVIIIFYLCMYTKVEKFRVVLKNETPDYINASYVKVCDMIHIKLMILTVL